MGRRAEKTARWREIQEKEREAAKKWELQQKLRTSNRSTLKSEQISHFASRMDRLSDALGHLGVSVKFLNHGMHVQFRCDDIIGNFYPTTNRLFIQRPAVSPTISRVRHGDALLAFLRTARRIGDLPELYAASWASEPDAMKPSGARRDEEGIVQALREELLRLAAHRPYLLANVTPREFEFLVAEMLRRQGWDTTVTMATGDRGRDVIAVQRAADGRRTVMVVECKQWLANAVSIDLVQRLIGVRYIDRADHAMLVTTSRFTGPARQEAQKVVEELTLVDREDLGRWLVEYDSQFGPAR